MSWLSRLSLLSKILLSISIAITLLFLVTGWLVLRFIGQATEAMIHDEVQASFQAYDSLWRSRAALLASVSRVLSSMSDVRAAFSTGDRATIRDTAGELWARMSDADAIFLVTDTRGQIIASLGGEPSMAVEGRLAFVDAARARFPEQAQGFVFRDGGLYQVAVTPVYVQAASGQALLNVVVAGYRVDWQLAHQLKKATGGSEFLFLSEGQVLASTLSGAASQSVAARVRSGQDLDDYSPLRSDLLDLTGKPVAQLWILRSFEAARQRVASLRRNIVWIYLLALTAGLGLTYLLARRIVEPIKALDRAAAAVARQNYEQRVAVSGEDELGRLAATFNTMCDSIQGARDELIRQERIATIGQLSTSIVHDLRNPLAAIYGGAEMLVDSELPQPQVKRLAGNIYRASRNIQDMLQELSDVARGRVERTEHCRLRDVVAAGCEPVLPLADIQGVTIRMDVPDDIELGLARARMERVFTNLVANAIEAMKNGGEVRIGARRDDGAVFVDVTDTGPGIPASIRGRMFQPFVTEGKKTGLGLGLALSRQTVLNHGGDLWLVPDSVTGAHFRMRLSTS
jgi:signal transduction histidine kinase